MDPIIISVEGNIGSGKSTFVTNLVSELPNTIVLPEPVDEWNTICDKNGETMLSKFYANKKRYAFGFQMMAYISRLALLKKTVENNPGKIIITERCLTTDREVFAKMLYNSGDIEEVEYQIYLRWFDNFKKEFPISKFVYLKTTATIAHQRVIKRNRSGETISLEYLEECHKYHNHWLHTLDKSKILILNANNDI